MALYDISGDSLIPIKKENFEKERHLQNLTEKNLNELFNLEFVASEFQVDNLRIDTLAYNPEIKSFVIIEYKKGKNYSVVDQGYTYLSLLLNNKAEFVLKYNQVFNTNHGKEYFDFSQTSVMFISPSYTKYQLKSVEFKDISFELWKVTRFSNGTVLYDKINNTESNASIKEIKSEDTKKTTVNREIKKYTEEDMLSGKSDNICELYESFKEKILDEFDDIEINPTKFYIAFKANNKIVISLLVQSSSLKIWINLKKINDPENKIRDVTNIGHHGIGNFEIKLKSEDDFYYFMGLFKQAYDDKF